MLGVLGMGSAKPSKTLEVNSETQEENDGVLLSAREHRMCRTRGHDSGGEQTQYELSRQVAAPTRLDLRRLKNPGPLPHLLEGRVLASGTYHS